MTELSFSIPTEVQLSQKKKFILNQNHYRNTHFRDLAKAKALFNVFVCDLDLLEEINNVPFSKPVRFHYEYWAPRNQVYDRMNVLSIADKFLCDALIGVGVLKDDDYKKVLTPTFENMGVDRANPRLEVTIREVEPMDHDDRNISKNPENRRDPMLQCSRDGGGCEFVPDETPDNEKAAYAVGGEAAFEYAKSIDKRDLGDMSGEQWEMFCENMCRAYHDHIIFLNSAQGV